MDKQLGGTAHRERNVLDPLPEVPIACGNGRRRKKKKEARFKKCTKKSVNSKPQPPMAGNLSLSAIL